MIAGVVALIALSLHGANYAALKTRGDLNRRARIAAARLWPALVLVTVASLGGDPRYPARPAGQLPAAAGPLCDSRAGGGGARRHEAHWAAAGNERGAFLCSGAYLVLMLVGAAAAVYPNLLLSTTDPALNITVYNAHSGEHSLKIGLIWWSFGMALAIGYFVFVYRMFRGKIAAGGHG